MAIHNPGDGPIEPNGGAIVQAIYGLREDVASLRAAIMPREETTTRLQALGERIGRVESSPAQARGWLNIIIAALAAFITAGGCLVTLLIGIASIAATIIIQIVK